MQTTPVFLGALHFFCASDTSEVSIFNLKKKFEKFVKRRQGNEPGSAVWQSRESEKNCPLCLKNMQLIISFPFSENKDVKN